MTYINHTVVKLYTRKTTATSSSTTTTVPPIIRMKMNEKPNVNKPVSTAGVVAGNSLSNAERMNRFSFLRRRKCEAKQNGKEQQKNNENR